MRVQSDTQVGRHYCAGGIGIWQSRTVSHLRVWVDGGKKGPQARAGWSRGHSWGKWGDWLDWAAWRHSWGNWQRGG